MAIPPYDQRDWLTEEEYIQQKQARLNAEARARESRSVAAVAPPAEQGDFSRNFSKMLPQTKQLMGGTLAFLGETFGSDDLKEYGLGVYEENAKTVEGLTRDSDSFTNVLHGSASALDFVQGALGYVTGQALEAGASMLAGGLLGSAAAPGAGTVAGAVGGLVGKSAIKSTIKDFVEARIAKRAFEIEVAAKASGKMLAEGQSKILAKQALAKNLGQVAGAMTFNLTQTLGSIYPEALADVEAKGGKLTGEDLLRIGASGVGAAAIESWADKIGLKKVLGGSGATGIAKRAAVEVPTGVLRESGTEAVQTGIERFGAGKALTGVEATREYIDSAAIGAVGGGAVGGVASLQQKQEEIDADKLMTPEERLMTGSDSTRYNAMLDRAVSQGVRAVEEKRAQMDGLLAGMSEAVNYAMNKPAEFLPEMQPPEEGVGLLEDTATTEEMIAAADNAVAMGTPIMPADLPESALAPAAAPSGAFAPAMQPQETPEDINNLVPDAGPATDADLLDVGRSAEAAGTPLPSSLPGPPAAAPAAPSGANPLPAKAGKGKKGAGKAAAKAVDKPVEKTAEELLSEPIDTAKPVTVADLDSTVEGPKPLTFTPTEDAKERIAKAEQRRDSLLNKTATPVQIAPKKAVREFAPALEGDAREIDEGLDAADQDHILGVMNGLQGVVGQYGYESLDELNSGNTASGGVPGKAKATLSGLAGSVSRYSSFLNAHRRGFKGSRAVSKERLAAEHAVLVKEIEAAEKFLSENKQRQDLTAEDIHALADSKNIPWDDAPAFKALTKKLTGEEKLDDLNPEQLAQVYTAVQKMKALPKVEAKEAPAKGQVLRGTSKASGAANPLPAKATEKADYEPKITQTEMDKLAELLQEKAAEASQEKPAPKRKREVPPLPKVAGETDEVVREEDLPEPGSVQEMALQLAENFVNNIQNGPDVHIVKSIDDVPKAKKRAAKMRRGAGSGYVPVAALVDGTVYIFEDRLPTDKNEAATHLMESLLHETAGHWANYKLLGLRMQSVYNKAAKLYGPEIMSAAARYGWAPEVEAVGDAFELVRYDEDDERHVLGKFKTKQEATLSGTSRFLSDKAFDKVRWRAFDETVAKLAESDPYNSLVQEFIAVIREMVRPLLRAVGIELKLSDAEMIRDFISPAREMLLTGNRGNTRSRLSEKYKADEETSAQTDPAFRLGTADDAPRVTETGKIVGSPPDKSSAADRESLVRRIVELLDHTLSVFDKSHVWYEESGAIVRELTRGDKELTEDTVRLMALYSQANNVGSNATAVIKSMVQMAKEFRRETKLNAGRYPDQTAPVAWALLSAYEVSLEIHGVNDKILNFYQNLIDPALGQNKYPDAVTLDRWMMRLLGYPHADDSKTGGANALSATQYAYARDILKRVGARHLGRGGKPLLPRQVQAVLWAYIKNKDALDTWKATRANIRSAASVETDPAKAKKLRDKAANMQEPVPGSVSFADYFERAMALVTWETIPGDADFLPWLKDLTAEQKADWTRLARSVLLDEDGNDELLLKLGMTRLFSEEASVGSFDGAINPNIITGVALPGGAKPSVAMADAYAAALGYLYRQKSMLWHRADPKLSNKRSVGAISITMSDSTGKRVDARFYKALQEIIPGAQFTKFGDREYRVLNLKDKDGNPFSGLGDEEFFGKVAAAADALESGMTFEAYDFRAEANLFDGGDNYEGYISRFGTTGPPDLQEWLNGKRAALEDASANFIRQLRQEERGPAERPAPARTGRVSRDVYRGSGEGASSSGLLEKFFGAVKSKFHNQKPRAESVRAVGVHYSTTWGLKKLDPKFAGSGSAGGERRRFGMGQYGLQGGYKARLYYYAQTNIADAPEKERVVSGPAAYRTAFENLYDFDADPLSLFEGINQLNMDEREERISEAGFDGYVIGPVGGGIEEPVIVVFNLSGKQVPVEPAFRLAYHGSRHDVDRMSTDRIGTGEGAQAYGWGLYFAENRGTANTYKLAGQSDDSGLIVDEKGVPTRVYQKGGRTITGRELVEEWIKEGGHLLATESGQPRWKVVGIERSLMGRMTLRLEHPETRAHVIRRVKDEVFSIDMAIQLGAVGWKEKMPGNLYEVEIDDDAYDKMLDWDAKLSKQPETIEAVLKALGVTRKEAERAAAGHLTKSEEALAGDISTGEFLASHNSLAVRMGELIELAEQPNSRMTGEDLYNDLRALGSMKKASELLAKAGIPGIKYRDAFSRQPSFDTDLDVFALMGRWAIDARHKIDGVFDTKAEAIAALEAKYPVSRNIVVFDDKLVTITKKNGELVTKRERAEAVEQVMPKEPEALEPAFRLSDETTNARHYIADHKQREANLMRWFGDSKMIEQRSVSGPGALWIKGMEAMTLAGILEEHHETFWAALTPDEREELISDMSDRSRRLPRGKSGKPAIWYHGTARDIHKFRAKQAGAIFISQAPDTTDMFAGMSDDWMNAHPWEWMTDEQLKRTKDRAYQLINAQPKWSVLSRDEEREAVDEFFEVKRDLAYMPDELHKAIKEIPRSGQNIIALYVRAVNAFDYENEEHLEALRENLGPPEDGDGPSNAAIADTASVNTVIGIIKNGDWVSIESRRVQKTIKALGHDGFFIREDGKKNLAVYESTQLKSVYGNSGEFGDVEDIAFRIPGNRHTWDAPDDTDPKRRLFDNIKYMLQDKLIDLKDVLAAIKKAGGQIADEVNAYARETLFHERAASRTKAFWKDEMQPLLTDMHLRGVTIEEVETYLHNRQAEETNKVIAQRNPNVPDLQDGGSGVSTADAKKYLAGLSDTKRRALGALAAKVDAITQGTRDTLVEYGLESQDTINGWKASFPNYIPLHREDKGDNSFVGQGMSVRGGFSKSRTGSKRKVVDILGNLANQRDKAIVQGEKNRVSLALYNLVVANPNPAFWDVDAVPNKTTLSPSGIVYTFPDPNFKSLENVVTARRPRADGVIEEVAVVFNEGNPRGLRLSKAMKNLDMPEMGEFIGAVAKGTRYFASVNTQYNPIFGVVNLIRDVQTGLLNLSSTPLRGKQAEVYKLIPSALRGIYVDLRAVRRGEHPTSQWAQEWEEFQREGGPTGYRDMFRNGTERTKKIKAEFEKIARDGTDVGKMEAVKDFTLDWLTDYNSAMENAMRLAAYKVAKETGMSKQAAAVLAKNLTVNFNKKGQLGGQIGALYAFFNASTQGIARLAETMAGPAGKKIFMGGVMLGVIQELALGMAGFDDDQPPEWLRQRNLIIPTVDGKYVSIPMPLGFHVIPNLGRLGSNIVMSGFKNTGKRTADLIDVLADAFNPIGNAGVSLQTIAPTVIDPLAALSENRDFTGRPIAKEDFSPLTPEPGFTRAKDTATSLSKYLSHGLNWLSGGTEYQAGAFSPTPDQIDYLLGQATGGVGRELMKAEQTVSAVVTGEELPTYKIPLYGRLSGSTRDQSAMASTYFDNLKRINAHGLELKGRRDAKRPVADYLRDNPDARLVPMASAFERRISQLRKRKRELVESNADRARIKTIDNLLGDQYRLFNERVKRVAEGAEG